MTLQETLKTDMITAMKAKDKDRLRVLRNTIAAVNNAAIDHTGDFTDADVQSIIASQVKQLKDANTEFEKGGRADLIAQNNTDIAVLDTYLPEQLSDDALAAIVETTAKDIDASTPQDMGKLMSAVMKQVQGTADGNRVKEQVMKVLNG